MDGNTSLGDPHRIWYRFNGREMGSVTNDRAGYGYAGSIAERQEAPGTGAFRQGSDYGGGHAAFGQAYTPITSFAQGAAGGGYTAEGGETLGQVAAGLWGDAALWYKLAQANGMGADTTLIAGQRLTIPAGVVRASNTEFANLEDRIPGCPPNSWHATRIATACLPTPFPVARYRSQSESAVQGCAGPLRRPGGGPMPRGRTGNF